MSILLKTESERQHSPGLVESRFFPALDELRFFAALAVMIHHIEQAKADNGFASYWGQFFVTSLGKEGVRLFFVLSGFLITFQLLKELKNTEKIHLFAFYTRRALRIWPLYFLTVLAAFFPFASIFSNFFFCPNLQQRALEVHHHFLEKLWLFIGFLPNLCLQIFPPVFSASQCWTLGIEEQYYILFPLLLVVFRRAPVIALIALGSVKFIGLYVLAEIGHRYPWNSTFTVIHNFLEILDFEAFAAGGIAAILISSGRFSANRDRIKNVFTPIICCLSVILFAGCTFDFLYRSWLMTAGFAGLILILVVKPAQTSWLSNKLRYFGKISYGIYMYHSFVIFSLIALTSKFHLHDFIDINLILYSIVPIVVLAVSSVSYQFFESPFLKLKQRFNK